MKIHITSSPKCVCGGGGGAIVGDGGGICGGGGVHISSR